MVVGVMSVIIPMIVMMVARRPIIVVVVMLVSVVALLCLAPFFILVSTLAVAMAALFPFVTARFAMIPLFGVFLSTFMIIMDPFIPLVVAMIVSVMRNGGRGEGECCADCGSCK